MVVNEKLDTDDDEGVIVLTGIAHQEDDQIVSVCPQLGTSSCGDTVEEAFENLGDAIRVHVLGLIETGEILRELRARNIRVDLPSSLEDVERSVSVPPGKIFTTYQERGPVTF